MMCEICRCTLPVTSQLTNEEIIEYSCDFLKIKKSELISKSRIRKLVEARYMIAYILYHNTNKVQSLTLLQIGKMLGKRDHSTIVHAFEATKNWCQTDEGFKNRFFDLNIYVLGNLNSVKFFL